MNTAFHIFTAAVSGWCVGYLLGAALRRAFDWYTAKRGNGGAP